MFVKTILGTIINFDFIFSLNIDEEDNAKETRYSLQCGATGGARILLWDSGDYAKIQMLRDSLVDAWIADATKKQTAVIKVADLWSRVCSASPSPACSEG